MFLRCLAACALVAGCGRFGFETTDAGVDAPDAPSPVPAVLNQVDSFATSSAAFVTVPGSAMMLPAAPGRRWLLLTSALIESTASLGISVEARYLVDGVEHGIGGTQTSAPGRPGHWLHVDLIDGEMPHEIVYELRDAASATSTLQRLHVAAIPLVTSSVRYAFVDAPQLVTATAPSPHTTLSLGALSGDYVFFLLANASDFPGLSNVYVGWRGPSDETWLADAQQPRESWQSYLVMQRATVEDPDATVTLLSYVGSGMSQVSYVRAIAIRTDAFASVDFAADDVTRTTTALPAMMTAAVAPEPVDAATHVVVSQIMLEETCGGAVDAERNVHLLTDESTETVTHATDNCAYAASYGAVRTPPVRPSQLAVGFSSQNATPVVYLNAQVLLLGLP